ncbi:MAG TPA: BTAD domain-containing putative transcriptional regulator, partial [Gaiellaceae bacterium]
MARGTFEFRILGPLEVRKEGRPLRLGGAQQRALLAVLLLHPNRVVPIGTLVEELWGPAPPETAIKIVHNIVSRLRRLLEAEQVLITRGHGYLLRVEPGQLDANRFELLVEEARSAREAGHAEAGASTLRDALALWRGPALADVREEPFAQKEVARLEELLRNAIEDRIEADLTLGRHADLIGELEALVAEHPFRERLRAQLMLALYRSGRQAEALDVYREARRFLVEQAGIEPGPALQRLQKAILVQDSSLELADAPARPPAEEAAPAREVRKTVSVVSAALDPLGRRLDPEALRRVIERAVAAVREPAERHGGLVREVVGGEVMALFGVPLVHEDDALRAVHAVSEAREALAGVNEELERDWGVAVTFRAAVTTGEALVEEKADGDPIVAGDLVELGLRLVHAAAPNDILIAETTRRLVEDSVVVEPEEPLELENSWRLIDVSPRGAAVPRRADVPMVDREHELAQLRQALERTIRERTAYLFTVVGPAGIGKSRLAREFASSVAADARVLSGRCPSYGGGVTFTPLVEVLRQAPGETSRLANGEDGVLAERIIDAVGRGEAAGTSEETFWATRRFFEALARERPLVLVFEDLHWAEPTFLDLVEHVAERARDAPILLLCLARPELLENRPSWGGGKRNATTILLEPLSGEESETLLASLLGAAPLDRAARERIAGAAEGNPLFLEQLLAMVSERPAPGAELAVPPTIQALLAARLDSLELDERAVLERASVVGREFSLDAVLALSPGEPRASLVPHLHRLARRDLIRPSGDAAADDTFRFQHSLIREVAYDSIPKHTRADLHERLAGWVEYDEVVGYHLEQAYRCRVEVGPVDDHVRGLARRAAERLASAGQRTYARGDPGASVGLMSRAASLLERRAAERLEILPDLGDALRETGDFPAAEAVLDEAVDAAVETGNRGLETYARVIRLRVKSQTDPVLDTDELLREADRAIEVLTRLDDARRLAKAWELRGWLLWFRCRAAPAEEALRRAIQHARSAEDRPTEAQSLNLLVGAALWGPMPVSDAAGLCGEILALPGGYRRVVASALRALAGLQAMEGRFDDARVLVAEARSILDDLGLRVTAAWASETAGLVELFAGDPAAAERELRPGFEELELMGDRGASVLAALLAQAISAQGRDEEALRFSDISASAAPRDAIFSDVQRGAAHAKILARLGKLDSAQVLAREAVARAAQTDLLVV